jgi:pSer/pThr/pTyr-binding forkhead associated (FHA) protein
MSETRTIVGHAGHDLGAPHVGAAGELVPLRLRVESSELIVEITCPIAIVGRHTQADLRLDFPDVSRRHCRLVFESGQWRIQDLKSLNGVCVNNRPVAEALLFAGDLVKVGCVTMLVLTGTPIEPRTDKLMQIAEKLPNAN